MAEKLLNFMQADIDLLNSDLLVLGDVEALYDLTRANGVYLDNINSLVDGIIRPYTINGTKPVYGDVELRNRIYHKIDMNNNAGTIPCVIKAIQYYLMLNDSNSISNIKNIPIRIHYSGSYIVAEVDSNFIVSRDKCREVLNYIPVGIGFYLVEVYENNTFTLADHDGLPIATSSTLGLSDLDLPSGGKLAEIISTYERGY